MTTRPYAAARRTLSLTDKLYEVNWGLVLLIAIIATAGFAMLYSVAGGSFSPWASPEQTSSPERLQGPPGQTREWSCRKRARRLPRRRILISPRLASCQR
jgi:hypothetical protein